MQRLHEDDLVGYGLAQEPWEVVSFPAIAEVDEAHRIETIWEPRGFTRARGEALHPEREPLDTLERIRPTIGEYNFAGQYQQAPAPLGGGLVKAVWFKRYREKELPLWGNGSAPRAIPLGPAPDCGRGGMSQARRWRARSRQPGFSTRRP